MVIDSQGNQRGVMDVEAAIRMAQESNLDLVQISDGKDTPVCKILDYGKYLYKKQKKDKQNKKNQHIIHVKEIRLRLNTGEHDLMTKLNKAKNFLEQLPRISTELGKRNKPLLNAVNACKSDCEEILKKDSKPFFGFVSFGRGHTGASSDDLVYSRG